jgi:Flp pilus assembly protein TadG
VDFALSILFVLLTIFGIFELSLFIYTYAVLADAAKEGVRYAVVHGSNNTSPSGPGSTSAIDGPVGTGVVETYARASFHDTTLMTGTVSYPDTANPPANQAPNRVQVQVQYVYRPFLGLGWPSATVYANAEGRIVY